MKIGIVTCFNMKNVNYGNRLQAFALNRYLRNQSSDYHVETLQFSGFKSSLWTKDKHFIQTLIGRAAGKLSRMLSRDEELDPVLTGRLSNCNDFSERNIVLSKKLDLNGFIHSDYDVLITGSDIVWHQKPNVYRPLMFLDYELANPVKRIAYAASFGKDYIPESNKRYIKKALDRFSAISVREKSSVALLNGIGVEHVSHCIDPTLLLDPAEWRTVEKEPASDKKPGSDFMFVYLLGDKKEDRESIRSVADRMNLQIVNVPFARGKTNRADEHFGDIQMMDCSPEEWLWLIDHSKYVITDSFHGVAFSTIFEKPFVIVGREEFGINNRLHDYLKNICQEDKFTDISSVRDLSGFVWDYNSIKTNIDRMKNESERFLKNALQA